MDEDARVDAELAPLAVSLLKGVIYREEDERLWGGLLSLQARLRDYVAVLGLELVLDEAEGYAFLKSREPAEGEPALPRLIARRPLSFPVSLTAVRNKFGQVCERCCRPWNRGVMTLLAT